MSHNVTLRIKGAGTYLLHIPGGCGGSSVCSVRFRLTCHLITLPPDQLLPTAPRPFSNPPRGVPSPVPIRGQSQAEDSSILLTKGLSHEEHFILTLGSELLYFKNNLSWSLKSWKCALTTLITASHSAQIQRLPRGPHHKAGGARGSLCQQEPRGGRAQLEPSENQLSKCGAEREHPSGGPLGPQSRCLEYR